MDKNKANIKQVFTVFVIMFGLVLISQGTYANAENIANEVIVAVIDSGVDYNHPDLKKNMWRNPGEIPDNGIDDDGNGFIDDICGWDFWNNDNDPMDDNGHGTHIAGTIIIDETGRRDRIIKNIKIMALKIDNNGVVDFFHVAKAICYATTMGAKIINLSLIGENLDKEEMEDLKRAVDAAGALLICAAGNNGPNYLHRRNNDNNPLYPACFKNENIIAVTSVKCFGRLSGVSRDQLSDYSRFGKKSVDLAAYGLIYGFAMGGGYVIKQGTSMATALVSLTAALLLVKYPDLSAITIKSIILYSVKKTADLKDKVLSGGILDITAALKLADAFAARRTK